MAINFMLKENDRMFSGAPVPWSGFGSFQGARPRVDPASTLQSYIGVPWPMLNQVKRLKEAGTCGVHGKTCHANEPSGLEKLIFCGKSWQPNRF
jgi:hypothetical protein